MLRVSLSWSTRSGAEMVIGAPRTVGATGISLRQERSRCGRMRDYTKSGWMAGKRS
jgi:hypothetical protein